MRPPLKQRSERLYTPVHPVDHPVGCTNRKQYLVPLPCLASLALFPITQTVIAVTSTSPFTSFQSARWSAIMVCKGFPHPLCANHLERSSRTSESCRRDVVDLAAISETVDRATISLCDRIVKAKMLLLLTQPSPESRVPFPSQSVIPLNVFISHGSSHCAARRCSSA